MSWERSAPNKTRNRVDTVTVTVKVEVVVEVVVVVVVVAAAAVAVAEEVIVVVRVNPRMRANLSWEGSAPTNQDTGSMLLARMAFSQLDYHQR